MSGSWTTAPSKVVGFEELPPQPRLAPVKVLHVITRFWAGAGGNTLLTATGTDPRRFDVWIAGCPGGDLWDRAREAGIRCVEVPGFKEVLTPKDAVVLWRLVKLMRRERFSVVHTHSAKGGFLGRLAAWLTRTPVVVHTFHGFSVHPGLSRLRAAAYACLERLVRPMTDAFLAVSPCVAREAVEQRFARPGSVAVAPSAVELEGVPGGQDRSGLAKIGLCPDRPVVGTVGRIDDQKCPLDFVRMAAKVHADKPDVQFVVVGDGPLAGEVDELARSLGVEVLVTGYRPDAPLMAAGMDVFVITSAYEGLGRALTEALASERPVVATAVNGVPDLVEPGATGLLAESGDIDGLATCVRWMLDNREAALAMGRAGAERVRAGFSTEVMCAEVERLYDQLLGQPVPASPIKARLVPVPVPVPVPAQITSERVVAAAGG